MEKLFQTTMPVSLGAARCRPYIMVVLLHLSIMVWLSACSAAAPAPTSLPPSPIPDDAIAPADVPDYGLVPGDYRLSLVGAVAGQTATSNDERLAIEYGAALAGMSHPGTNTSGNVGLGLRAVLPSGVEALLLLEFPGDIGTGTHQIGTNSDLNPAPVGAVLRVNGRAPFDRRVSGTLTLDFINRRSINGELDVTLLDSDGQSVTARGAFHRIPFSPREEYDIQLSGIYQKLDSEPQYSKGIQGARRFITLRFMARRTFAEPVSSSVTITAQDYRALQAGEYNVLASGSPVTVEVRIGDEGTTIEQGTVLFVRTFDNINGVRQSVWQGGLTLRLQTGAGETTLTGLFNHFDPF